MKDVIIAIFYTAVTLSIGLYLGNKQQRLKWEKLVPSQMDAACEQCLDIGVFKGYKQGKAVGLQSCSDMIDAANDGRR